MSGATRLTSADMRRFKSERRANGAIFSLAIGPTDDAKTARFAVVVSKKVAIRANKRNLIKRRARAVVRELLPSLSPGRAYVFTAKRSAALAEYAAIDQDIRNLLGKA